MRSLTAPAVPGLRREHLALAAGLLAVAALYAPVLRELAAVWNEVSYYSYGFLVVPFSAYVTWQSRRHLVRTVPRCTPWGLTVAGAGLVLLLAGTRSGSLTIKALSLPVVLGGIALFALGPRQFRPFAFPVAFLAFMAPLPEGSIAVLSPLLQHLAAWVSDRLLAILGVPVYRDGLFLYLPNVILHVTEACNGLRFLLAMIVIGVACASTTQRRVPRAAAVVALAIVVALGANWLRVAGTGVVAYYFGPEAITGFAHIAFGKVVYLAMLVPFLGGVFLLRDPGPAEASPSA